MVALRTVHTEVLRTGYRVQVLVQRYSTQLCRYKRNLLNPCPVRIFYTILHKISRKSTRWIRILLYIYKQNSNDNSLNRELQTIYLCTWPERARRFYPYDCLRA